MHQLDQGLDLAQPPGGYGPPPGGAPPGGWGPPPGGAPPGGWGPPGGGAPPGGGPPGGAPPGGWGPPGGAPPGGYGQPPGGYGAPPGSPPGGYGAPPGGGYPPGPPGYPSAGAGYPGAPGPGFGGPTGPRATFSPGDAVTFAWERIKADPGTILATVIVGLIIASIVSFGINLVAQLVVGLAGAATSVATGAATRHHASPAIEMMAPLYLGLMAVGQLVSLVVSTFVTAGIMNFSLKVARGTPYAFGDLFSGAPFFLSLLITNLILAIAIGLGLLFLIVPGVILALGMSMAMPLVIDRGLGPIDALKASWELTDGNKGTILIFGLIAFGLSIAGMCACFVGILLVIPLLYIAHMYIYLKLSGQPVAQVARAA